ncbi:MAG: hypothetical protein IPL97_09845 [Niastella sp.]|nr:hypothetical protein [Niastella sp.]
MKDSKTILLLTVSILLLIASMVLLWTWGYNYGTHQKTTPVATVSVNNFTEPKNLDSTAKNYLEKLTVIDKSIDSVWGAKDTLKADLASKLAQFYTLRQEINTLLNKPRENNSQSTAILKTVQDKLTAMQLKITELRNTNLSVENENRRLNEMLKQLRESGQIEPATLPAQKTGTNNTVPASKSAGLAYSASNLNLTAYADENTQKETINADQVSKIVGSFTFKNNSNVPGAAEVIVVVLQPNGKVLQKSAWESGTFISNNGKMIYSCKLRNDYAPGESRKLAFTLNQENYLKGNYTMQVYYNGVLIAKTIKSLS